MIEKSKTNCCGCTACMVSCPKHAISMQIDEQGFKYPYIDMEKCINCGLCDKICPFEQTLLNPQTREAYAVKHKDKSVLKESTSGGIFTAVSDYVINKGGVVYGAAFDENMVVRHIRATTKIERNRMRGSKYVQSDLGEVFLLVKQDLNDRRLVLFTGTPCQIAGLRSYMGNNSDGLICLDLICHGVPSPVVFNEHIHYLSGKLKTAIVDYKFRPKEWGWHVHRELVIGTKRQYHSNPFTDLWRNIYYSRIATRPSCNNCPYSNLNRIGDITIGDCRGIDNILSDFESYDGVTLAIVNTRLGKFVLEQISNDITYSPLNIDDVIQPPLKQSSSPNKNSERFFADYKQYGYKKAIMKHYGRLYPLKYYIKKWMREN
jgi:coenzyme F420-reducing hydrogenase beta subunit